MTKNDRRRDALIGEHMDAARRVARKVARSVDNFELRRDVEAAGLLGLAEAAARYDANHGEPFFAFAVKRVRGAALDELRRADPLPRRDRYRVREFARALARVEARTGEAANSNQVADEIGVTVDELEATRSRVHSMRTVRYDDVHEHTTAAPAPSPLDELRRSRELHSLARALHRLAQRDREVLALYYGGAMNLREIGDALGVSESRVCQLKSRAVANLRHVLVANQ